MARVRLSCVVEEDGARRVFDSCSAATAAVIRAMRAAGIADDDLSTTGVQLSRRRDTGRYLGQNSLTVTVRPPERAGEVVGLAVDAGGDAISIDHLQFGLEDSVSAESDARAQAVAATRRIAEEVAAAAGVQLGELVLRARGW